MWTFSKLIEKSELSKISRYVKTRPQTKQKAGGWPLTLIKEKSCCYGNSSDRLITVVHLLIPQYGSYVAIVAALRWPQNILRGTGRKS